MLTANVMIIRTKAAYINDETCDPSASPNWLASIAEIVLPGANKEKLKLFEFPIPTIAMIHNACLGGAVGYPASCDIVVASNDARFAITEVKLGITPAPILPQVISAVGTRVARRFALTGSSIS